MFSLVGQENGANGANGANGQTSTIRFRTAWHYPFWAYGWGQPWWRMQSPCYFDPALGAWVCPQSPWAFSPLHSWFWRPMGQWTPWTPHWSWGGRWG